MELAVTTPTTVESIMRPLAQIASRLRDVVLAAPRQQALARELDRGVEHMSACTSIFTTRVHNRINDVPDRFASPDVHRWLDEMDRAIGRAETQITAINFALDRKDLARASQIARALTAHVREAHTKILAIAFTLEDKGEIDPAECGPLEGEDREIADAYAFDASDPPEWTGPEPTRGA